MKTIVKISAILFICILSFSLLSACARGNNQETTAPTTDSIPSNTIVHTTSTAPETTAPKTMYYSVTEEERLLIAQLVYREANTESLECQKAIVSVLFNRLACGKWGDTIEEVIYYKNAFTPATAGLLEGVTPTKTNYEAVDFVLENGSTLPTYVRYFRAGYHHSWEGYEGYTVIDHTYFGYFIDWQKGAW